MQKRKSRLVWKILSFIICAIIPITGGIFLALNIKQQNEKIESVNAKLRSSISSTDGKWNLNSVDYIYNNLNYYDQYRESDISNVLDTSIIDNQQYINKVYSASSLGNLNFLESYTNMESLQFINSSNFLDEITHNYKYRYITSSRDVSAWSSTKVSSVDYYGINSSNQGQIFTTSQIPNFSLENIDKLGKDSQAKFNLAEIPDRLTDNLLPYQNDFYTISKSTYQQITDDKLWISETREQLVVTWTNQNEKNYIDTSTIDFWINFLMRSEFKNVSRLIVEPANLIIYRNNENVQLKNISLNDISAKVLLNENTLQDTITFENWIQSCINTNPIQDFDFRSFYSQSTIESLLEINIPLIVKVDDETYKSTKKYSQPSEIASNMLFAKKPMGETDRNWGNIPFTNLRKLFVSSNAKNNAGDLAFNMRYANDIDVANTYTNAETNADNNDASNQEFFSNQYYTCPNLQTYITNDIESFFINYEFLSQLPLYKVYNNNDFSDSSYTKYKNLNLQFIPEINNYGSDYAEYNLRKYINSNNDWFNVSNINNLVLEYLNYFSNIDNRDINVGKTSYLYFETFQNQWYSKVPTINNLGDRDINLVFRYDYLYGFSNIFQNIVLPFSMFTKIVDQNNPYYLENNLYSSSQGTHITRYVDPTTATIVYSQNFISIDKKKRPYPELYLTNEEFENFLIKKMKDTGSNVIDFTFDDWVNNGWTSIDPSLDIINVLRNNNAKINNLIIPKIILLNNNTTMKIKNFDIDTNLIVSIVLIILICLFALIELFIFIMIIKTPGKYNWAYLKAQEEFGF